MDNDDNLQSAKILQLEEIYKGSPFNITGYTVNSMFYSIPNFLADYCGVGENEVITTKNFSKIVPPFQREIKHWTLEMKKRFVENVLLGVKTDISFYCLNDKYTDCRILDGQHRLMSIIEFIEDKFTIFNNVLYSEIKEHWIIKRINRLSFTVYVLSYSEAIDLYIKINEGITHTPEDIERARLCIEK